MILKFQLLQTTVRQQQNAEAVGVVLEDVDLPNGTSHCPNSAKGKLLIIRTSLIDPLDFINLKLNVTQCNTILGTI